jgi:hypothetical protein
MLVDEHHAAPGRSQADIPLIDQALSGAESRHAAQAPGQPLRPSTAIRRGSTSPATALGRSRAPARTGKANRARAHCLSTRTCLRRSDRGCVPDTGCRRGSAGRGCAWALAVSRTLQATANGRLRHRRRSGLGGEGLNVHGSGRGCWRCWLAWPGPAALDGRRSATRWLQQILRS